MMFHPLRTIPVFFLFFSSLISAQVWVAVDPALVSSTGTRDIVPDAGLTYSTDYLAIRNLLWSAPAESSGDLSSSQTIIPVGLADGTVDLFRIARYDMMEEPLSSRYLEIRTFKGVSVTHPFRRIRADWTTNGFRAVISEPEGKTYIDPYQRGDLSHRIVYYRKDFTDTREWTCDFSENDDKSRSYDDRRVQGDCVFRSYRLAVATTGEYSNFFGATSSAQSSIVLSEVVTAVNRVNDVYEVDVAVRLILIGNTDAVFYYNPSTDPFSGGACNHLTQNQNNMTSVIGSSNYDVGHVFSVGNGGCAVVGVICSSSNKARGATALNPPTGDPFYIDYVAHELGHQFGANHTQNNNCNRYAATAMEPGSASTIMGYAGICSPNVQSNSDPYLHAISLQEMADRIGATNCHATVSTSNSPPNVSDVPNYTIPKSTPFVLTAIASDPEGNPLTYCWEQMDQEVGTMPPVSTNTVGPMFRSLIPSASPSRYFPNLPAILAGNNPTWEVLASVSRDMEFRITVRDLYDGTFGCTDEDNTIITTTATSGPFVVTSQNSPTTWLEGASHTITWDVANTTASPVSCAFVDIRMSMDGGMTYPVALSLNEPNDGSATINVPIGTTTMGRIMVRGSNNIFFDVNNANITVDPGVPNFTISLDPASVIECNDGTVETTVVVGQFMGFTDPVTLSAINLPAGATPSFIPPVVIPGNNSTLIISNLGALQGVFTPTIRGTSSTGNKDVVFNMTLVTTPEIPVLLSPANNANDAEVLPLLDWTSILGSISYDYQIATEVDFTNIVQSGASATDQFQVVSPLAENTEYYWRVRVENPCGISEWSDVFSFTTVRCVSLLSTNVPVTIPSQGSPTVTSILVIPDFMTITDVNVISLVGTHTWVNDLRFSLISPGATERIFWNQPCGNHDNFNIHFDDEAANNNWPCPPTDGMTYRPDNTLSIFDGQNSSGTWTLKIKDVANHDGGSLTSWGLKVCGIPQCELLVDEGSGTSLGSLPAAVNCAGPGDTIMLSASLAGQTINIGSSPLMLNKDLVILALGSEINIAGSGTRIFEIAANTDVEVNGATVTAGTSMTGGAFNNSGMLLLKNVSIRKSPFVNGATLVQNLPGSSLTMIGNCLLQQ